MAHPDESPFRFLNVDGTADFAEGDARSTALALGVFDGVHLGHQTLLRLAAQEAERESCVPAALTFDPLPAALFAPPTHVPRLLGTLDERARLLRRAGAEHVWVARFDRTLADLSPIDFVHVLRKRLNARVLIVGDDFRFGKNRAGDAAFLQRAGQTENFTVCVVPPVLVNGVPARSTRIRQQISAGHLVEAAQLLGRNYTLMGLVAHGRKMGRTLGFPTANLDFPAALLAPGAGVYAGYVYLADGTKRRAAISVGTNPTVTPGDDAPRTVEAYLMDGFHGDLYDQTVTIEFALLLRPVVKFDGLDALIEQMHRDVDEASTRLI